MAAPANTKMLLIGFGNPGRLDDGLGPALADAIEKLALPGVTVESNYQLTVEDAAEIAEHEVVLFADADVGGAEPFWVERLYPGADDFSFTSHSVEPRAVLTLARRLFQAEPEAYMLGIRGYEFNDFGERLSKQAQANLAAAVEYVELSLRQGSIREIRAEGVDAALGQGETTSEEMQCKTEST